MSDKHDIVPVADTVPTRALMHPLVERMLTTNPTPEALEKILTLQREWERGEAERAYTTALVALKGDLPAFLGRDKKVDFNNVHYTHTSLAGAMQTVTPHLTAHGFSLTWRPGTNDKGGVTVTATLTHRGGHSKEATLTAPPDTSGLKSSAQAIASTITLLQRYSALAILGLATADMQEPVTDGASTEGKIDTVRNIKAMASVVKAGKTKADAEKVAGKPMTEWTGAELDKLRAWLSPAPAAAAPTAHPKITKEAAKALKLIMDGWKMKPEEFSTLIETEIGRKLTGGAMDLDEGEYAELIDTFNHVESGAYDLKAGKIVRPS